MKTPPQLVIDNSFFNSMVKDDWKEETARAFAHLFAFIQGKTNLDAYLKEKFEAMQLLTPENELRMDDPNDSFEWLLLSQIFEGKMERCFNDKKDHYEYKNTELGTALAESLIRKLSKQNSRRGRIT